MTTLFAARAIVPAASGTRPTLGAARAAWLLAPVVGMTNADGPSGPFSSSTREDAPKQRTSLAVSAAHRRMTVGAADKTSPEVDLLAPMRTDPPSVRSPGITERDHRRRNVSPSHRRTLPEKIPRRTCPRPAGILRDGRAATPTPHRGSAQLSQHEPVSLPGLQQTLPDGQSALEVQPAFRTRVPDCIGTAVPEGNRDVTGSDLQ